MLLGSIPTLTRFSYFVLWVWQVQAMIRASGVTAVEATPETNENKELCVGKYSGEVVSMQMNSQPLGDELEGEWSKWDSLYLCLLKLDVSLLK